MQPEVENPDPPEKRGPGAAAMVAAAGFGYTLVVTLALIAITGFFGDEDNQRTILIWLTLPIGATFLAWMAVSSPNHYLRITVWFLVLGVLFFCWISIFSIGVYYLPAALLMVISVLGPWDGHEEG